MPLECSFLTFGKHTKALVPHYSQSEHRYANLLEGDRVANTIYVTGISSQTRGIAQGLGIDIDDASTWSLTPSDELSARLDALCEVFCDDVYVRDALKDLIALSRAGHVICFEPG